MSTIKPQQILIPKKVHIADTAELQCTFNSDSPLVKNLTKEGETHLSQSIFVTPINKEELEIIDLTLYPSGINYYQLGIKFIPWKTGTLSFPNIKIEDISLVIQPEEITSLTEQHNTSILQESWAPLLLPGTTYKLYGSIIFLVILLIVGINLIIKRKKVNFYLKTKKLQRKYKKNKKLTEKKLLALINNQNVKDSEIAGQIQNIVREYLQVRYDYPFTRSVTSELVPTFNRITQMLLSDKKNESFGEIAASFIRTDYIRYSSNATFLENEKQEIIQSIINNIEILEGDEDA